MNRSSPPIYLVAAVACLVAPALPVTSLKGVAVWPSVILAGAPMSIMAIALAIVHAQYGLVDRVHRAAALAWTGATLLLITPIQALVPFEAAHLIWWAAAIAAATVALLFGWLTVRARRLPGRASILLALGLGAVALFFGFRAGRLVVAPASDGLEGASEALAEFFIDAVFTSALILPGIVAGWVVQRRVQKNPAG